jgi:hypothetical protein
LGVNVNEQYPLITRGKGRPQIDGGGRLADPAFLVDDGDDAPLRFT